MAGKIKTKIRETALALVAAAPSGLRYRDLKCGICERLPGVSPNVVADAIQTLRHSLPPGFTVKKGVYGKRHEGEAAG